MTPRVSSTTRLPVTTDPWSPELIVRDICFVSQNLLIGITTSLLGTFCRSSKLHE
jgi:hypothetical protein